MATIIKRHKDMVIEQMNSEHDYAGAPSRLKQEFQKVEWASFKIMIALVVLLLVSHSVIMSWLNAVI